MGRGQVQFQSQRHPEIPPSTRTPSESSSAGIASVSGTENQGGELVSKAIDFAALSGFPGCGVRGCDHSLQLPNGAKPYALTRSTESGPSRTAGVSIFDEAALVRDNVFLLALPLLARTGGSIWMLSTPRGQSGFFYNFWHDKDSQ